jgi:hypothetical protein
MTLVPCCGVGLAALFVTGLALAQPAPPTVTAPAPAASAPARAPQAAQVVVIEDDTVRIEETRVRGQTQRITVQSKIGGARSYEIIVPPGGKDASQNRGASGQRAWSLFDF